VTAPTVARWAGEPGLRDLLAAYHLATEAEKGAAVAAVPDLPARYRAEVLDPATAFAGATVLVARVDGDALVGCVVLTAPTGDEVEVKRLWVAESSRGRGVAGALMRAALAESACVGVRLSVWRWRSDALALYTRLGFVETKPWDDRPGLRFLRRVA
jgi:putative acetyltransferase